MLKKSKTIIILTLLIALFVNIFCYAETSSQSVSYEVVSPNIWNRVDIFQEGLARVSEMQLSGEKYGFIDRYGKIQIPATWDNAGYFSEGLVAVSNGGKYGYIDKEGRIVIPFQFDHAYDFNNGVAVVSADIGDNKLPKKGFINKAGEIVIPMIYDHAESLGDGYFSVGIDKDGHFNYAYEYYATNEDGSLRHGYGKVNEFSEGLAWVEGGDLGRGYINYNGELVISIDDAEARGHAFQDGRALIGSIYADQQKNQYYIDTKGEIIIQPIYYDSDDFHDGYAPVVERDGDYRSGKIAVIDVDGNILARFEGSYAYNDDFNKVWFLDSYGGVRMRLYCYDFYGDIDKLSGISFQARPHNFSNFGCISDNVIVAAKYIDEKKIWGAFDKEFNIIIPFEYADIDVLAEDLFCVQKDMQYSLINLKGEIILNKRVLGLGAERYFAYDSGVIRFQDDGELYVTDVPKPLGTAASLDIAINGVAEHAYLYNDSIYIDVDRLNNYGLTVLETLGRKGINIIQNVGQTFFGKSKEFAAKDSYPVVQSSSDVFVVKNPVDSISIDGNITIKIDDLQPFGYVFHDGNSGARIFINSPYLPNEGILWQWKSVSRYVDRGYTSNPYILSDYAATISGNATALDEDAFAKPDITSSVQLYPKPLYRHDGSDGKYHDPWISLGKYVDENDNVLFENPDWVSMGTFQGNAALVRVKNDMSEAKWGLIDISGNYIVQPIWDSAVRYNPDTIAVSIDKKYGIINGKGDVTLPLIYDDFYSLEYIFGKPMVTAKLNWRYGILDSYGEILVPHLFEFLSSYAGTNIYNVTYYLDETTYCSGIIQLIEPPVFSGDIYVNDEKVEFPVTPFLINNRTMIPVRAVFEKLGYDVSWIDESQTVVITKGDKKIEIKQDENILFQNDVCMYSDMPAINYKERIYIPLRAIAEASGCAVNYDNQSGNISIQQ